MIKKIGFMSIILILVFSVPAFGYSGEMSGSQTNFDWSIDSSRHMYNDDTLTMTFSNVTTNDVKLFFEYYTPDGNYLKDGEIGILETSDGTYNYTPFTSIDFEGYDYLYFKLYDVQDNEYIYTSIVAPTPASNWLDNGEERGLDQGFAIGNTVYNSDRGTGILFDGSNPNQVVYKQGDYFLLHYKVTVDDVNGGDLRFAYENNQDRNKLFDTSEIIDFQGVNDSQARENFILVSTDGTAPSWYHDFNSIFASYDNPLTATFAKGVHTGGYYNGSYQYTYSSQSPLFIGEKTNDEWSVESDRESYRVGSWISWNFTRNTQEIWNEFQATDFYDFYLDKDYVNQIMGYDTETEINYQLIDMETGETSGSIQATIKSDRDTTYFGYDFSNFDIDLSETYEIRPPQAINDALTELLENIGLGDAAGLMLFSIICIIGTALALSFYAVGSVVIAIAVFAEVGFFSFIGFLPLWLVIALLMLAFMIMVKTFGGGN